jgi:hypothetical protein
MLWALAWLLMATTYSCTKSNVHVLLQHSCRATISSATAARLLLPLLPVLNNLLLNK